MANTELKRVGLVLSADGAEDFQKTLKDVGSTLKQNQNEFKKTKAAYDENTSGLQKLRDEMKFAQAQAETYGDKVVLLKGKLGELQAAEKENFAALEQTKSKTEQLRNELEQLRNAEEQDEAAIKAKTAELEKSEKELSKLVDKENDYNSKIRSTKASIDDATIATEKYAKQAEEMHKKIANGSQSLDDLSKKLDKVSDKMGKTGDALTKGVTAPVLAVGTASMVAWNEVDEGLDIITKKTGATGDALADMQDRAKNLATSLPTDFNTAGTAIGEINTRFGLTGDALEDASEAFIKFAKLNETDVGGSIDTIQKSMAAFNLDAAQIPAVLDTINKAGQDSGASVDKLASDLVSNAGVLRELNLSYSDSVALFAQLEKSGADTSAVMGGLSKAWATAAKDGVSLSDALSTSLSSEEAAIELFGSKAGAKMFDLFQSGAVSLDMFSGGVTSLNDNLGNVSDTFEAVQSPADDMKTIFNELKTLGYEIGNAIGPVLLDIVREAVPIIQQLTETWKGLSPETQEMIVKMALMAAAAGPVLKAISGITSAGSGLLSGISKLMNSGGMLGTMLSGIGTFLAGPGGIVVAIAAVIGILVTLYNKCEWFRNFIDMAVEGWKLAFKALFDWLLSLPDKIKKGFTDFIDWCKSVPSKIKEYFSNIKTPHLAVSGSLNPIKWATEGLPKLKLEWYAKGGILNHPTIFGTNGSNLMAGGEAGPEAVMPLNTLQNWITSANDTQTQTITSAMESAVFSAVSKALKAYSLGVYLNEDKVGEVFSDLLASALRNA